MYGQTLFRAMPPSADARQVPDRGPFVRAFKLDRHHVKTQITWRLPRVFGQPLQSQAPQPALLCPTEPGFGRRQRSRTAGFDFDKHQRAALAQDQVNFAARTSVPLFEAAVPAQFQKDPRHVLAPLAEAMGFAHADHSIPGEC